MDPKDDLKDDIVAVLLKLHHKIDFLKEKVDKLCETTNCFEFGPAPAKKNEKEEK